MLPTMAAADLPAGHVGPGDWLLPAVFATLAAVGGLTLLREPSHRYGRLLFGAAIVVAPANLVGMYSVYALAVRPEADLPLGLAAGWVQDALTWPRMLAAVLLIPALFPDGRLVSGRWGRAVQIAATSWAAWTVMFVFADRPLEGFLLDVASTPDNPMGIVAVPEAVYGGWWALNMGVSIVVALGSIVVRFRAADVELRQQMKWPLAALVVVCVFALAGIVDVVLVEGFEVNTGAEPVISFLVDAGAVLFAIGLGLGVLRYRLYDVDRVINRTVVYALLTLGVFATYVLMVVGVGELVPDASEEGLALFAAVTAAVAFEPARRRLQAGVNRLMFGHRHDPYAVLTRMGDVMASTGTPAETLEMVVATVATSLKLPWVAVELHDNGEAPRTVEHGAADAVDAEPFVVPLVHGDRTVGCLLAAPRSDGAGMPSVDRKLLQAVAHQAGAVAANARLTVDLQRSRERLVLAREEERLRIRRDLHDGLGPSLAAQTLALDVAADRVADDPTGTRDQLLALKEEAQTLMGEIRRLVHELRPPALDELGLVGALVAQVSQIDSAGVVAVRIRSEPDPLPDLSAAVEVAAWRIVREALTNVLRHAGATSCTVTLRADDGDLYVQIIDDGVGLPVVPRPGVGLTSMRERAEELGGTLTATNGLGGGTDITAVLPVADRAIPSRSPSLLDGEPVDG